MQGFGVSTNGFLKLWVVARGNIDRYHPEPVHLRQLLQIWFSWLVCRESFAEFFNMPFHGTEGTGKSVLDTFGKTAKLCNECTMEPTNAEGRFRRTDPDLRFYWWRGQDLNLRPLGYEPNELPDCSTPRLTRITAGTATPSLVVIK